MSKKFMVEVQLLHHLHNVSKGKYCASNKKFSDLMQLPNQHPQIKICEASHFLHHFGIGSLQINFVLSKETAICVNKTATNMDFGNMKFKWKK